MKKTAFLTKFTHEFEDKKMAKEYLKDFKTRTLKLLKNITRMLGIAYIFFFLFCVALYLTTHGDYYKFALYLFIFRVSFLILNYLISCFRKLLIFQAFIFILGLYIDTAEVSSAMHTYFVTFT
jgi:hypothetical protein